MYDFNVVPSLAFVNLACFPDTNLWLSGDV